MRDRFAKIKDIKRYLCPALRELGITTEQKVKIYEVIDTVPHKECESKCGTWTNESVFEMYDKWGNACRNISRIQCTVCGRYATKFTHHVPLAYCPHCGAFMRSKE